MHNLIQNRSRPLAGLFLGATFAIPSAFGQGFPVEVFVEGTFVTSNGDYSFTEVQSGSDVFYYVDILTGGPLGAAVFSFDSESSVIDFPGEEGPGEEGPGREPIGGGFSGYSNLAGWGTAILSEEIWDADATVLLGGNPISTAALGTFDSLFGMLDDRVLLFNNFVGDDLDESNDNDGSPFLESDSGLKVPQFVRNSGEVATNALFFDNSGNLVGSTIPEPAVSLLVGLSSLMLLRRRRN